MCRQMYKARRITRTIIMITSKPRKMGVSTGKLFPTTVPTYASNRHHGNDPRNVYMQNLTKGILVIPAGSEIYVRTIGKRREKKAVALLHLWKNRSAISASCCEIST